MDQQWLFATLSLSLSLSGRSDYSSADASEGRQVEFLFSQLFSLRWPNQMATWRDDYLGCHLQGDDTLHLIDNHANAVCTNLLIQSEWVFQLRCCDGGQADVWGTCEVSCTSSFDIPHCLNRGFFPQLKKMVNFPGAVRLTHCRVAWTITDHQIKVAIQGRLTFSRVALAEWPERLVGLRVYIRTRLSGCSCYLWKSASHYFAPNLKASTAPAVQAALLCLSPPTDRKVSDADTRSRKKRHK